MATMIDIAQQNVVGTHRAAKVYYSDTLKAFDWTQADFLVCDKIERRCGPEIDQAFFTIVTGDFADRDDSPFGTRESGVTETLDINRKYCKVVFIDGNGEEVEEWYGKFLYHTVDGARSTHVEGEVTGFQQLVAYGLLVELDETLVTSSEVRNYNDTATRTVNRGIPFNYVERAGGYSLRGNKQSGSLAFSDDPFSDVKWTADSAIQYLLQEHAPKDSSGNDSCDWEMAGVVLDWYDVSVDTDRVSVKSIIDHLVDRRRLAGYWVAGYESGTDIKARITLFTFTQTPIETDTGTIPENEDQVEISLGDSPFITDRSMRTVDTISADRIIVEGDWISSTCTVEWEDLEKGWESADETDYLAGAGNGDEEENTIARSRDALRNVFSRFIVAESWDRLAREGYRVTLDPTDIPPGVIDDDLVDLFDAANAESPWWFRGKRFLDYLAIKNDDTKEFERPFALFPSGERYVFAEQASVGDRNFSCNVSCLDDRFGFRCEVNREAGQSLLADGHWGGADATPEELDPAESLGFDYEDVLFTGTVEWDERVFVEFTINASPVSQDRVYYIRVPDARLDFVVPGTVTDVEDDGSLMVSDGKVLRDDRNRLAAIGLAASKWYGSSRQVIQLGCRTVTPFVELGQLVVKLISGAAEDEVNTPITGITYDLSQGMQGIQTSYADADFAVRI